LPEVVIVENLHAEHHGEFPDMAHAVAELKRRAAIPWDQPPNLAPCTSWRTCGRAYELIEYDDSEKELCRTLALEIRATGITWTLASDRRL